MEKGQVKALDHKGICPFCKENINPEAVICKVCRSDLREGGCGCSPTAVALSSVAGVTRDSGEAAGEAFKGGIAARALGWRIPIGPIVIGPQGTDCIYIDDTKNKIFCVICPTLTSCHTYG